MDVKKRLDFMKKCLYNAYRGRNYLRTKAELSMWQSQPADGAKCHCNPTLGADSKSVRAGEGRARSGGIND